MVSCSFLLWYSSRVKWLHFYILCLFKCRTAWKQVLWPIFYVPAYTNPISHLANVPLFIPVHVPAQLLFHCCNYIRLYHHLKQLDPYTHHPKWNICPSEFPEMFPSHFKPVPSNFRLPPLSFSLVNTNMKYSFRAPNLSSGFT